MESEPRLPEIKDTTGWEGVKVGKGNRIINLQVGGKTKLPSVIQEPEGKQGKWGKQVGLNVKLTWVKNRGINQGLLFPPPL